MIKHMIKCSYIQRTLNYVYLDVEGKVMNKTYQIEVDCAACAAKMEDTINKVEGVVSATISFMTQKLSVEFEEDADTKKVMKKALKSCRRIEPDFEILG